VGALFRLRDEVTKVLESARAAKQIGQSLEADIVLYTDAQFRSDVDLSKLFIVSHVDCTSGIGSDRERRRHRRIRQGRNRHDARTRPQVRTLLELSRRGRERWRALFEVHRNRCSSFHR
jgi:isoleucyl-tRNA synthetase